jgi:hypothetical protein
LWSCPTPWHAAKRQTSGSCVHICN